MGNAGDILAIQAMVGPDRLAVRDLTSGRSLSYVELDGEVAKCAAVLKAHGIETGDRVASLAKNRLELVLLLLASARIGAIYVPLNWRLAAPETKALLEDAQPSVLFAEPDFAPNDFPSQPCDDLTADIKRAEPLKTLPRDPDRPSLILYTSGTTGRPKGALLSEKNLDETAINYTMLGAINRSSRFLCDAPMFHIIGLVGNTRPALINGASFLISDGFTPARTLERLTDPDLAITHYFCVPQMAAMLRKEHNFDAHRLKHLTAIFTGGAPHPAAAIKAWLNDGIPIADGLGMSEAGSVFRMPLNVDLIAKHAGAVGVPTSRVLARIVDDKSQDVPVGTPGELWLKGPNVIASYWRQPELTAAAFTEDGWFRTGDIARQDEDGFYWLVDRSKDMFISGGENVYPAEIEAVLAGYEEVSEAAVVGVPDEQWGEVGHLFLLLKQDTNATPQTILERLNEDLAKYKIPKHVTATQSLPRNAAGKLQKAILRERAAGAAQQKAAR